VLWKRREVGRRESRDNFNSRGIEAKLYGAATRPDAGEVSAARLTAILTQGQIGARATSTMIF
jgi:hypothetical protein